MTVLGFLADDRSGGRTGHQLDRPLRVRAQRRARAAALRGAEPQHPPRRQPAPSRPPAPRARRRSRGRRRRRPSRAGAGDRTPAGGWSTTTAQALAGPFADRIDADWAALADGLPAVSVYGARSADGHVAARPSPEERAWLAELGDQLDRLPTEWDELLSDTDPLTTLVVEVAAALVEAGLPLHDAPEDSPAGGVCLMPELAARGVVVSWRAARPDGPAAPAGRGGRRHGAAVDERRRRRRPREPGLRGRAVRRDGQLAGHGPALTAGEPLPFSNRFAHGCPGTSIADISAIEGGTSVKAVTWHGQRDVRVEDVPDPIIEAPMLHASRSQCRHLRCFSR